MEKSVIYKMNSYTVVRIVTGNISFNDLKEDEDFMPLSLWNEGSESFGYPLIK